MSIDMMEVKRAYIKFLRNGSKRVDLLEVLNKLTYDEAESLGVLDIILGYTGSFFKTLKYLNYFIDNGYLDRNNELAVKYVNRLKYRNKYNYPVYKLTKYINEYVESEIERYYAIKGNSKVAYRRRLVAVESLGSLSYLLSDDLLLEVSKVYDDFKVFVNKMVISVLKRAYKQGILSNDWHTDEDVVNKLTYSLYNYGDTVNATYPRGVKNIYIGKMYGYGILTNENRITSLNYYVDGVFNNKESQVDVKGLLTMFGICFYGVAYS